ncbi:MAG: AAA family ATPase [Gammaproteobacteria bacterium]|nr:AAA family ATPase [Gammaproteobacteria bacterium]
MKRSKLPIGIQTFQKVREEGRYYVDKTAFVRELLAQGDHFFLSRPRRFGKSLFLDMLKELFEGNEALFQGLDIHDDWDWSVQTPVVRLDFSGDDFSHPQQLNLNLLVQLETQASNHGIPIRHEVATHRFEHLLRTLHAKSGRRVVVLVDEYDQAILNTLNNPSVASAHREFLRGFYSVIKFAEAHIEFSFITGVSKFAKVSLFSGLNNLIDITLDPSFSSICGYTESDLESVFTAELTGLDRNAIREWYNGYSWLGEEKVYNPFDILLLLSNHQFRPYWLDTGTSKFLVETLFQRQLSLANFDGALINPNKLSAFDIDAIAPEALLFQTGYLTINSQEQRAGRTYYRMGYPNREVREGLNRDFLDYLVGNTTDSNTYSIQIYDVLQADSPKDLEIIMRAFFASIPYQWYTKNDIANYEGFYAAVFYSFMAGVGMDLSAEDSTNKGSIDLSLTVENRVYVFEFKVVEQSGEGTSMDQLKSRNYSQMYRTSNTAVTLIGVEFSSEQHNVVSMSIERTLPSKSLNEFHPLVLRIGSKS